MPVDILVRAFDDVRQWPVEEGRERDMSPRRPGDVDRRDVCQETDTGKPQAGVGDAVGLGEAFASGVAVGEAAAVGSGVGVLATGAWSLGGAECCPLKYCAAA